MALTNTILNGPEVTGPYDETTRLFLNHGTSDFGRVWTITTADLVALGAFTTGDITFDTAPAGSILTYARISTVQEVVGPSISAGTARITFNGTNVGTGTLDIVGGAANDVINDITGVAGSFVAANLAKVHITVTGANASVITAGELQVWYRYIVLK